MSKVLRISDVNYKVIVGNGGTITLDTTNGELDGSGTVVITGDLQVKGNTTTIESTISTIADNIIVLSSGNTNSGLPASLDRPYSSGIEIDRGLLTPSRWIYDDSISWSLGGTSGIGTWVATQGYIGTEQRLPLATPGIIAGGNLYISTGSGVISVTGTSNYEEKVWRYESGVITPDPLTNNIIIDDDHITNAKAVKDYVDYQIDTVEIGIIQEDNSKVEIIDKNNVILNISEVGSNTTIITEGSHGYGIGDTITITGVTTVPTDTIINDINGTWTVTDVPSRSTIQFNKSTTNGDLTRYVTSSGAAVSTESIIKVVVEDEEIVNFYSNRVELSGIEIKGTEITTFNSNEDLILAAPGTGSVTVKDTLSLTKTPGDDDGLTDPNAPVEGVKIYSKTPDAGKTGVYFINENDHSDELISKNRALLFSMLF
jgi:hypothetical protein